MRIRQLAFATHDLAVARSQLFALLGLDADFSDPGVAEFGLHNSVVATGTSFLEIVSPFEENTAVSRMLDRMRGDCGYMALFQVDDLAPVSERVEQLGLRKIWQVERAEVKAFHVHPKDIGGALVSFDEMIPAEAWVWAGSQWQDRKAECTGNITGCQISVQQPQKVAETWAHVLGINPEISRTGGVSLAMTDGAMVQFVAPGTDRREGLTGVELAVTDPERMKTILSSGTFSWDGEAINLFGVRISFAGL
ncbi:MAG TPA: hypothetical protein EYQ22_14720 [Gammaproteobacteria bacterium]|nr:hypothetical protein [Gammaproteobacteria bacterium]HIK70882.1 hypothetical protein [Pseudomonadales bacterium]